ncbi:MAG TPA: hypothetical protein VMU32_07525 [Solirubrobacteraceae bacterium]|nr:hypothetical protein [Solirubrobacteraceae bacterium]
MRKIVRPLAVTAAACLCSLLVAAPALAGSPATVTVRIQGLGGEALLPQTQVTTSTTPIPVEGGGTCEGTSAGGAVYDATGGKWKVKNQPEGVELQGLEGLDLPEFSSTEPSGIYWAFWLEGKYAEQGVCSQSIASGQHIVLFPQCYATGPLCPTATAPADFLTAVPAAATADVGQQVPVTFGALNTETAAAEGSLPEGDLLSDGAQTFAPAADGVANVSFSAPGLYTLQAHAPDSVASEPFTICVHNGNDGTCGTTTPANGGPEIISTRPRVTPSPDLPQVAGVTNGRDYRRRSAPRLLEGSVAVPTGETLHELRLSLQRRKGGRCFVFNGRRAAFTRAKCGRRLFFKVAETTSYSYLLPKRLPAGRYVYEIEAVNDAGVVTKPVAGVSRVTFDVK